MRILLLHSLGSLFGSISYYSTYFVHKSMKTATARSWLQRYNPHLPAFAIRGRGSFFLVKRALPVS